MPSSNVDWPSLRVPMIRAAVALVIGVTLVAGSMWYRGSQIEIRDQERHRLQALETSYWGAVESQQTIRDKYPRYLELRRDGFVGAEPRLLWVEGMRRIARDTKLPGLAFRIAEQHTRQPEEGLNMGSFNLYASAMQLQIDLWHEGDLFAFLDSLYRQSTGVFDMQGCEITRKSSSEGLYAKCNLYWYTLHIPNGDEEGDEV